MNESTETTSLSNGMSSSALNGNGSTGVVQRVAQKAHEAVDKLEQTVSASGEKMTGWQEEYGGMVREQVKGNPLTAVGIAFAAGILFNRILGR